MAQRDVSTVMGHGDVSITQETRAAEIKCALAGSPQRGIRRGFQSANDDTLHTDHDVSTIRLRSICRHRFDDNGSNNLCLRAAQSRPLGSVVQRREIDVKADPTLPYWAGPDTRARHQRRARGRRLTRSAAIDHCCQFTM